MLTTIPFSGFYETLHDSNLDQALDNMFSDYDTGCDIDHDLRDKAYDLVNWSAVHQAYAKKYAEQFAYHFKIDSLKFESMQSPKFYNYTTDRIFCTIDESEVRAMLAKVDAADFAKLVKETFTSRDGFISSYSPDLEDWGDVADWDHNQVGTLLQAYVNQVNGSEFDYYAEQALIEDWHGNCVFDELICANADGINDLLEIHSANQESVDIA